MNALKEGYAMVNASTRWDLTAAYVSQDIISMKASVSVSIMHCQRLHGTMLKGYKQFDFF
jgi:hypothetical protein